MEGIGLTELDIDDELLVEGARLDLVARLPPPNTLYSHIFSLFSIFMRYRESQDSFYFQKDRSQEAKTMMQREGFIICETNGIIELTN